MFGATWFNSQWFGANWFGIGGPEGSSGSGGRVSIGIRISL